MSEDESRDEVNEEETDEVEAHRTSIDLANEEATSDEAEATTTSRRTQGAPSLVHEAV